jgi:formamidopyrimidine-DNA glycosylase
MPELPEVETVRRGLAPVMEGARFVAVEARRGDLRWPLPKDFAARLKGQTVLKLGRRAKYLLADLSGGEVLLMHLGMSGSFRVNHDRGSSGSPRKRLGLEPTGPGLHDHVVFHMSSGATITFNDPRRFGSMLLIDRSELENHRLLAELGSEPLARSFDAASLARSCQHKDTSLKAALLDQSVVAGLGNIYVCEALHRARLSPTRKASTLARRSGAPTAHAERLVSAIKEVLAAAIKAGGSSLRDHRRTNGDLGYFQHHFRVYDRAGEPCPTPSCGGTIRRMSQNGRSTFFCPRCQK